MSMIATLTPAHLGHSPSRFAVSTTSYWDTLQQVDRIACIDPHKSRKLGRKTGWFPAGALLRKWTEEIYPAITTIINDAGNYERIFGKHNKEVSRPCWLYMVGEGEQWITARPTIVAICSKTRIAQRICDLLQNIACMRALNLGFDYMYHKEKVILVTGNVDPATLSNLPGNLCGLRVLASTYPASLDAKWTQTTIGGTLKINQEHYCLSVAHAFHLDASVAGDGDSDSSSDTDNGSHEPDDLNSTSHPTSSVSMIACRPDVLENVELGLYFGSGPISTCTPDLEGQTRCSPMTTDNFRVIGSGRVVSGTAPSIRSLLLCIELDWVLLRVSDPQFFGPNLVHTPSGTMLSPQRVSMKAPHGKVLVAAGVSGVFESYCPGIIGGLSLPGSFQMVDVWTIESSCCETVPPPTLRLKADKNILAVPGDCGSWVIDPITGDIYGIIIATAPEAQESYMIPAYQVYGSIMSRLPRGTAAEFAETQKEKQTLSQDAADIVSEASDMMGAGRGAHGIKRSHSMDSYFQEPVLTSVTERGECSIQNSLQVLIDLGSARSIPSSVAQLPDLDSAVFDTDHAAANTLRQLLPDARGEVRPSERMEDSIKYDDIRSAFNQGSPIQPLLSGYQTSYQPIHSAPSTSMKRNFQESEGLFPALQLPNLKLQPSLTGPSPVVQPANVDITAPRPSPMQLWSESEKIALLMEISKDAQVDPVLSLARALSVNGPEPRWEEITLPAGRSLRACKDEYEEIRSAFNQCRPIQPLLSGYQMSYQPVHSAFSTSMMPNLQPRPPYSSASPVVQPANIDLTAPRPSPLGAFSKPKGKPGRPTKEEIARRQAEAAAEGGTYVPPVRKRNKPKKPKALAASPVPPSAGASASIEVSPSPLQTPTRQAVEPQQSRSSGRLKRPRIEEQQSGPDNAIIIEPTVAESSAAGDSGPMTVAQSPSDRVRPDAKFAARSTSAASTKRTERWI